MVKPARLGSSVGMTLVHDSAELRAGARPRLPLRHARARRDATSPGARDLEVSVIGNDHARLELYGPGEIVSGHEFYDYAAKYTPGLSETSTRAEVSDADARVDATSSPATPTGRSAPRASRASTSSIARRASSCPRSTRSRASRRSASSRRCPPRRGHTFTDVCVRIVDLALERHAARPATRLATGDLPR